MFNLLIYLHLKIAFELLVSLLCGKIDNDTLLHNLLINLVLIGALYTYNL